MLAKPLCHVLAGIGMAGLQRFPDVACARIQGGHYLPDGRPIRVADFHARVLKELSNFSAGFGKDLPTGPIATGQRRRFADDVTSDQGGPLEQSLRSRKTAVREAFNSPFWPFVLATTSVGQEGLDFHLYCRDIVHWNLPSNPVDLEQREGRINRRDGLLPVHLVGVR